MYSEIANWEIRCIEHDCNEYSSNVISPAAATSLRCWKYDRYFTFAVLVYSQVSQKAQFVVMRL